MKYAVEAVEMYRISEKLLQRAAVAMRAHNLLRGEREKMLIVQASSTWKNLAK